MGEVRDEGGFVGVGGFGDAFWEMGMGEMFICDDIEVIGFHGDIMGILNVIILIDFMQFENKFWVELG